VALSALLAWAFLAGGSLADDAPPVLYHAQENTYGCADPDATRKLTNPDPAQLGDPAWVNATAKKGQCVAITPRSPWRVVTLKGDVALMAYAGDVGPPGSYYFSVAQLFAADGTHPGEPSAQPAASAAPDSSSPTALAPNNNPAPGPLPARRSWSAVDVILAVIALAIAGGLGFLLGRAKR
jgi:hypothetical protein